MNDLYDADRPSLNIEGKENGQLPPENYSVSGTKSTTSLPTQAELNLDAGRLFAYAVQMIKYSYNINDTIKPLSIFNYYPFIRSEKV